jgi:hypothetical protein
MRTWCLATIRILSVTVLIVIAARAVRRPDPTYHGQPLSHWLNQCYENRRTFGPPVARPPRITGFPGSMPFFRTVEFGQGSDPSWPKESQASYWEAAAAIRQIGTNGLPYLLKLMSTEDSALKKLILSHEQRLPLPLYEKLCCNPRYRQWRNESELDCERGCLGFALLGWEANPVAPDLTRIMRISRNPSTRAAAAKCLDSIGRIR